MTIIGRKLTAYIAKVKDPRAVDRWIKGNQNSSGPRAPSSQADRLRALDTRKPPKEIFRIGRKPSPWQPPDWSHANADGTFGNRFDDPAGYRPSR